MHEVIGIGVDLCGVARMEKATEKPHFMERVFTPGERAYLERRGATAAQSAAAIFAAKEAVAKALKTGFSGGVAPACIEVTHEESGAPGILLHGKARERMQEIGGSGVMLSLSHEGDTAIAFAVIQGITGMPTASPTKHENDAALARDERFRLI